MHRVPPGAGNLAAAQVANAMMDVLANFAVDSPVFLKTVHIVIFQSTMMSDFEDAMKKFKRISRQPSSGKLWTGYFDPRDASCNIQSDFYLTTMLYFSAAGANPAPQGQTWTSGSTKPIFCLATETATVTFPVTDVEVYGISSTDIAKVKKFLDDLVSEECMSGDVQSSHLASFPEADNKTIVELSQSNQVRVCVAAKDKLNVSGKKDDVLNVILHVNKLIQAARDRESREEEERRLSKTLRWEVAEGEAWKPLNSSISYELELAFHKKEQTFKYQDKGETFTVDFKDMKRVNAKGKTCKVKRTLFADSDTGNTLKLVLQGTWSLLNF